MCTYLRIETMPKEQLPSINTGSNDLVDPAINPNPEKRGRSLLFITATHGDEGYSIDVIKSLEKELPKQLFEYEWVIGNAEALKANTRFIHFDLNRIAPGSASDTDYEMRRVAQLMTESQQFNSVIDIHGTVSDVGICTIIPYPTLENLFLSLCLPIQRNVIWYAKASSEKGPISQYSQQPALEIECGPKDSEKIAEELKRVLSLTILRMQGIQPLDIAQSIKEKEFYVVYGECRKQAEGMEDFQEIEVDSETFYPFLVNQYREGAICYKMKRIDIAELFLY